MPQHELTDEKCTHVFGVEGEAEAERRAKLWIDLQLIPEIENDVASDDIEVWIMGWSTDGRVVVVLDMKRWFAIDHYGSGEEVDKRYLIEQVVH